MSETPTYSYRLMCYRKDGEPIDPLLEMTELRGEVERLTKERDEARELAKMWWYDMGSPDLEATVFGLKGRKMKMSETPEDLILRQGGTSDLDRAKCVIGKLQVENKQLAEDRDEARDAAHYFQRLYGGLSESDLDMWPWMEETS